MPEKAESFDQWCVLELFGHQRLAGLVTEANLGSGAFLRVDVPGPEGETLWTRFYNPSAVYSISPVSKDVAVAVAQSVARPPVHPWEVKQLATTSGDETDRSARPPVDDDDWNGR